MTNPIRSVRGMEDLLGDKARQWTGLEDTLRKVFSSYGYEEVRTPLVESESLFKRGVGEDTDIVSKEMYSFLESSAADASTLVLRPEGTAPVVRALVEHKAYDTLPVRWFYVGPMYRKERPQKGRYRQFHQYGFEIFGGSSPWVDAEALSLVQRLLQSVGLKNFEIHVNSLGDAEDRILHRKKLVEYFGAHKEKLSELSQTRLEKNPLRILDSKAPEDIVLSERAPKTLDCLGPEAKLHWEQFLNACHVLNVPVKVNKSLVRGLDYYCRTVFEIVDTSGNLGAQAALGGGGRYDGLVQELGGPALPAFGFAGGFERLILALGEKNGSPKIGRFDLGVVAVGEREHLFAAQVVLSLRDRGFRVDWEPDPGKSFKAQFKRADKSGVSRVWILGGDELTHGVLSLKDMATGQEAKEQVSDFSVAGICRILEQKLTA